MPRHRSWNHFDIFLARCEFASRVLERRTRRRAARMSDFRTAPSQADALAGSTSTSARRRASSDMRDATADMHHAAAPPRCASGVRRRGDATLVLGRNRISLSGASRVSSIAQARTLQSERRGHPENGALMSRGLASRRGRRLRPPPQPPRPAIASTIFWSRSCRIDSPRENGCGRPVAACVVGRDPLGGAGRRTRLSDVDCSLLSERRARVIR